MKIYDLDVNEKFDIIKIGERDYKIGDIPVWIYKKIQWLNTWFSSDRKFFEKWKEIIIEMLEIKNEDIDVSKLRKQHILKIIDIILNKIKEQDDYKI